MKTVRLLFSIFIILTAQFLFAEDDGLDTGLPAGACTSFTVDGNRVVFSCENGIEIRVTQLADDILKIWAATGEITGDESYAVLPRVGFSGEINISEQEQSYEIYTGKLIVRINKDPFRIRIFDKYQRLLVEDFSDRGFLSGNGGISSGKTLKPGERIYGLGEKNGNINRVGSRFTMWNSDKPCYQVHEDPLYKSIPFFISSEGYGIYFDNTYKTEFDFGVKQKGSYHFGAPGGEMLYYVIYGPSLKQVIARYTWLTGNPMMPPEWAFGFSQSRGLLTNESLTREIASGYRDRQIPCDIIYQDIGWTQHLQDFEWREGNYDNPVKMISDLESQGFKVIVSQDPVISKNNIAQWSEADELGYLVKDSRTGKSYDMPWPWGGNCGVVDFTNPAVADWWGEYQQKAIDDGVRGFWTDMGEPAWSNEESTDRLNMVHHDGMHDEIHNVYGLTWDKVVTEQFEKRNPGMRLFQMTRAGFAGMQRYTFGWSGDAGNGNDVTNGWGELAAQVPMAMSAGMGVIPFWSCDISGYCGDINDYDAMSELYIRWLQFGAFNPLSRIHHEGNNAVEPWLFGTEAEEICKSAITLKYSLFPYIYSYAREAYEMGWPLIRPMVMEYPDDKECFDLNSQFMFGEELLVAPVVEEGAAYKKIYLPKGEWIDYHHPQKRYNGKQWINYPVSLDYIPLFAREGSIIPRMPVMQFIGEDADYPLLFEIFPAPVNRKSAFEVYEDDGETNGYRENKFLRRTVTCASSNEGYEVRYRVETDNGYELQQRDLFYIFHFENKPSAIRMDGKKVKYSKSQLAGKKVEKATWNWNRDTGECKLAVPDNQSDKLITIEK